MRQKKNLINVNGQLHEERFWFVPPPACACGTRLPDPDHHIRIQAGALSIGCPKAPPKFTCFVYPISQSVKPKEIKKS